MKLLSIAILLISSLPALAQFGAQAVSAGRWEPRNYTNSLGLQLSYCTYWTNGLTLNGSGVSAWTNRLENSFNLAQGTAASQPVLSRSDNKANLLVQSEEFDATWALTRATVDDQADTGPLGDGQADKFIEDGTAASTHYLHQLITASPGSYRYSVYAKAVERNWIVLRLAAGGDVLTGWFDVQNGVVGTQDDSGSASGAAGTISPAANGYFLCTMSGTVTLPLTSFQVRLADADNSQYFDGTGTAGVYIWGASLMPSACTPVTAPNEAGGYISTTATPAYPGLAVGGVYKPVLVFDGSNDSMSVACAAMVQPTVVIWGGRQVTWTSTDVLFDGTGASAGVMAVRQAGTTPQLRPYAGTTTDSVLNDELALGDWGVGSFVFDGATSWNQIDKGAIKAGDIGSNDGTGLTLARNATGTAASNIEVFGVLVMANTNLSAIAYARLGFLGMANTK